MLNSLFKYFTNKRNILLTFNDLNVDNHIYNRLFKDHLDKVEKAYNQINDEMKIAAVEAIRSIAKEPVPAEVLTAAGIDKLEFGAQYIIPKPMDPRLLPRIAKAVAQAAVDSGVAQIDMPENYMA